MFTLIATAAILSCSEAQRLAQRVPSPMYTRREYREILSVIRDSAPKRCHIVGYPTVYRGQLNRRRWRYPRYWAHPGVRPLWRRPRIGFNAVGEARLIWRFQ